MDYVHGEPRAPATGESNTTPVADAPGSPKLTKAQLMSNPLPLDTEARPTNVRYTVLAWACSLSMLTYIDRVCIKNVCGDMQTALGIDKQDFGWVFSAF